MYSAPQKLTWHFQIACVCLSIADLKFSVPFDFYEQNLELASALLLNSAQLHCIMQINLIFVMQVTKYKTNFKSRPNNC